VYGDMPEEGRHSRQCQPSGNRDRRSMLAVIAAVGQAEREGMLERQREGIAKVKREERYKGRVLTVRLQSACPSPSAAPPIR
jgi:DNA invertase Pin-like site-specific DNA recombinase